MKPFFSLSPLILLILAIVGCSSHSTRDTPPDGGEMKVVELSDMTVTFAMPNLRSSPDFGSMKLATHIDLATLSKPTFILHGYFDGPRYQLLSVTGTMNVWFTVKPWPEEVSAIEGCDAKLLAIIDNEISQAVARAKQDQRNSPRTGKGRVDVGDRKSYQYWIAYDPPSFDYLIPLNDEFYLLLMISSADNSGYTHGWGELFDREMKNFLYSVKLSDNAVCRTP